ncbi:MAG: metalloregulator ArsR/SmtB family transcription factor [Pseudomonadota bacterium]
MNIDDMQETADEVSGYMKLLGSPARLMILCQLVEGEKSVGALCDLLEMKAPAMSQQLARMRQEGILATRRDGQVIHYRIDDPNILKIMMFLYETFCGPDAKEGDR